MSSACPGVRRRLLDETLWRRAAAKGLPIVFGLVLVLGAGLQA